MDCFDVLIAFLERCTEEIRKANMTFIGGSTKWNVRHFKGRADIRGCMNSALVHQCKPSQADLLLENTRDRKLMQALTGVGQAVLLTDNAPTRLVQIPRCTRQDMQRIANIVGRHQAVENPQTDSEDRRDTVDPVDDRLTRAACQEARMAQQLSYRDMARKIGLTDKKAISRFTVRLHRYEKKQGILTPEEMEAVTEVLQCYRPSESAEEQDPCAPVTPAYIQ